MNSASGAAQANLYEPKTFCTEYTELWNSLIMGQAVFPRLMRDYPAWLCIIAQGHWCDLR